MTPAVAPLRMELAALRQEIQAVARILTQGGLAGAGKDPVSRLMAAEAERCIDWVARLNGVLATLQEDPHVAALLTALREGR